MHEEIRIGQHFNTEPYQTRFKRSAVDEKKQRVLYCVYAKV